VTRAAVLEVAAAAGLAVREADLPSAILETADEMFLTNTSWQVLPVVQVDARRVGMGRPGPITRDLLARYRDLVRRECPGA
jgi:branched-chain amino acid aminotransferase